LSKQIWLAPILSDKRERLIARASDVLAAGPAEALLYIAASRQLLELAADKLLDGVRNRGVWGSLPVHLFRGFARFVLATAIEEETGLPLAPRIAIDREELPLKRSIISQIIKGLAREGRLKAIAPLAGRDGCINSVATLIGEIGRAGKSAAEFASIVEARIRDFDSDSNPDGSSAQRAIPRQSDFDREVALIYAAYESTLAGSSFTEDDADQLRALEVLRGEVDGRRVSLPWLSQVRLLVLDGFFDFTPVQGEMLRLLIPQVPDVVVNLNRDELNAEVFRPFEQTIKQLGSMAEFELLASSSAQPVAERLTPLRERLFNPAPVEARPAESAQNESPENLSRIRLLECANRQTEIRAIAKEIKRLVLISEFSLTDIALVVRERASYEGTIARVFEEEEIPCALGRRTPAVEIPAVRAALRLIEMLIELRREQQSAAKVSDLADLIKSGYFRLSKDEVAALAGRFERDWVFEGAEAARREPPHWDADELENVIAYVGSELRVDSWLARARKLTGPRNAADREKLDDAEADDEVLAEDDTVAAPDEHAATQRRRVAQTEFVDVPLPGSERKPKPAREIDPAVIAWSALIIDRFWKLISAAPREGSPRELRGAMMRLLDELQFTAQVRGFSVADAELPALTLDLRGLESLRRSFAAATRSIEMSEREGETRKPITLATFLDEALRCLRGQVLVTGHANPDGLKVLEATDVRGLRFRALFIAGLIEGGFPLRASRDWIYPHEERERLKQYGLTLEDISPDTLLKEEHYFYQAACRATERLYLSRPLVLEDGSETVGSYYIEELRRAISPVEIAKETVRNDFDGRTLFDSSRRPELAMSLVRQDERHRHRAQLDGNFSDYVIARLMNTASGQGVLTDSARRRIAIERERGSRWFGKFDGLITSASLIATLRERYDAVRPFSASELSLYGKCPFKFFAEKVLRLEPRGEAAMDLTALDAGSLLHEVLRRFFEKHRAERLADLDRRALRHEIGEVADAVFDEHERAVPPLNPQVWRLDREIRKLLLEQVLDYELEIQEKSRTKDVRPAYFELAFGMRGDAVDSHSTEERLELRRGSEEQSEVVQLRGQIDRVDVAQDGTAVAYDYKLSRGAALDDMKEGRALQLHIYLSALEQLFLPGKEIAGAGYYTMKGGHARRNQGLYRAAMQAYTAVGTRTASTLADSEWKQIRAEMETRVWEFIDGIRRGRFVVLPSAPEATCPHCDFSAVCRYEKFRIRRKTEDRRPMTGDRRPMTEV
jgi:ATP-dependent helicase/DNAse subunit B